MKDISGWQQGGSNRIGPRCPTRKKGCSCVKSPEWGNASASNSGDGSQPCDRRLLTKSLSLSHLLVAKADLTAVKVCSLCGVVVVVCLRLGRVSALTRRKPDSNLRNCFFSVKIIACPGEKP